MNDPICIWLNPTVASWTMTTAITVSMAAPMKRPAIQRDPTFTWSSAMFSSGRSRSQSAGSAKPIRIGRGVRIGAGAVVLRGAVIGDGAVIEPNSVVSRYVPPGGRAAGVPARLVLRADHAAQDEPERARQVCT